MKQIARCIETLRAQLERHRKTGLKEYPTRTIFIDPMLEALGWDVRDPDDVELEYPTIDAKSVDYAMKINRKAVLLLEAKQLGDPLDDVKAITQVVGYAANDGIEWCILTNGLRYKVYKATEVIELYRALERICQDLAPGQITRSYKKWYIGWMSGKKTFCSTHIQRGGLRVWLKIDPKTLDPAITFARDVTKIGHWGVGDVELRIQTRSHLQQAEPLIRQSFITTTHYPKKTS